MNNRQTGGHPGLYNYYAGHDDNRDSFMNALPETTNMSRIMYREWFPQIMYNHHQSGPGGAVMFAPPFRDPHNFNFHPMVPAGIELVASAMHTRFIAEGKPGVVSRRGAPTTRRGGRRIAHHGLFHNQIGILTETIGNPTPAQIPFTTRFLVPDSSGWFPITPQPWHFRQSTRVLNQPPTARFSISRRATARRCCTANLQDGIGQHSSGQRGSLTDTPHKLERIRRRCAGGRTGGAPDPAAGRGGGGDADEAAVARTRPSGTSSASLSIAIPRGFHPAGRHTRLWHASGL